MIGSQHRNRAKPCDAEIPPLRAGTAQARPPRQARVLQDDIDGDQIRSYVLDQSRIKDLRTGVEKGDTQKVLRRRSRRLHHRELEEGRVAAMPEQPPQQDENQIIAERRAKLAELRKRRRRLPNDFAASTSQPTCTRLGREIQRGDRAEGRESDRRRRMMLKRLMGKASSRLCRT